MSLTTSCIDFLRVKSNSQANGKASFLEKNLSVEG